MQSKKVIFLIHEFFCHFSVLVLKVPFKIDNRFEKKNH